MPEPQLEILTADVMDALAVGKAVQEGEVDATVRTHPLVLPGYAIVINHAMFHVDHRQGGSHAPGSA